MDEVGGRFNTAAGSRIVHTLVLFNEQEMIERFANTARKMKHGGSGGRKQSHVRISAAWCLTNGAEKLNNTRIRAECHEDRRASSVGRDRYLNGIICTIQSRKRD